MALAFRAAFCGLVSFFALAAHGPTIKWPLERTLRYPELILRGRTESATVAVGTQWKSAVRFAVSARKFEAELLLKPGANRVLVEDDSGTTTLSFDYKPMKSPYGLCFVVLGGSISTTAHARLVRAVQLAQADLADAMSSAGSSRITFNVVQTKSIHDGVLQSSNFSPELAREIARLQKTGCVKVVLFDAQAPNGIRPDFVSTASISSLDIPHLTLKLCIAALEAIGVDSPRAAVNRFGNARLTLDPYDVAWLPWSPWMRPDGRNGSEFETELPPQGFRDALADQLVIRSPYGLRFVGYRIAKGAVGFKTFLEAPEDLYKLDLAKLRRQAGSAVIEILAVDSQGNRFVDEDRP